jgi:hypothetical protein
LPVSLALAKPLLTKCRYFSAMDRPSLDRYSLPLRSQLLLVVAVLFFAGDTRFGFSDRPAADREDLSLANESRATWQKPTALPAGWQPTFGGNRASGQFWVSAGQPNAEGINRAYAAWPSLLRLPNPLLLANLPAPAIYAPLAPGYAAHAVRAPPQPR